MTLFYLGEVPAEALLQCGVDPASRVSTRLRDSVPGAGGSIGAGSAAKAAPDVHARWTWLGAEPVDSTPAQFSSWPDSESSKWGRAI